MQKLLKAPLFVLVMLLLLGLAVWQVFADDIPQSDIENRPLKQFATPTLSTVLSGRWMQDMETYVADQFPARESWMDVQALWDGALLKNERNGILIGRSGWMFEQCANLNLRTAQANAQALDSLGQALDIPVSVALVPMSSAVYPEYLPGGYLPDSQQAAIEGLYAEMDNLQTVDVLTKLRSFVLDSCGRQDMLYYQTDHHWTAAGATMGYAALLEAWGLEAGTWPIEKTVASGFYGTYIARAPTPMHTGDSLIIQWPEGLSLTVEGEQKDGLYDPVQLDKRDKYAALLWGNHGQILLESDATGGTLFVIKDSYANMLLPMLSQHYSKIVAVDPRYFAGDIPSLIQETEAERVLCLYGLTTFMSDRSIVLLSAAWDGL